MNYQYTTPQQPQQQFINPAEIKRQRKEKFDNFCDRMNETFSGISFTRGLINAAEIVTYILLGICFLLTLLNLIISSGHNIATFLTYVPIMFAALSLCRRKALPIAITTSFIALCYFGNLIWYIVYFAKYGSAFANGFNVIGFIFIILELAVIAFIAVRLWIIFASTLPEKIYVQQPAPVYQQPAPAPVAPAQPAPAPVAPAQPAPAAPASEAAKFCSQCGTKCDGDSVFCSGCGTKIE